MKIGLYAKINRNIITSFADGVLACGSSPVWHNPAFFSPRETASYDFIAIWGGAGPRSREVINSYAKFKIKSLVFENGYVGENTHSISIGKHYWLPEFECPSDRMIKFGLKLTKEKKEDGYILALGQSAETNSMLAKRVKELKTDRKIVFRPHPGVDFTISGIEKIGGSFEEALSGAYCVMCHTSSSANKALLKGIPVFCSEQNMAAYISNTDLSRINDPFFPTDEVLKDYFCRLCYAVWTEEEIRSGEALKFYAKIIKGENLTPILKGNTKSIQKLKGQFKGQTAYIIGKGPSLKYLSTENFKEEGGVVIPLNEAIIVAENIGLPSSFSILSQQKDGKPECMVKPKSAPLLLHEQESKDWFPDYPERYIFDVATDYGIHHCNSVIAAIELSKLMGCKKIVFLCFDFYIDNISEYPKDSRLGKLHAIPNRLKHLEGQKLQIPLHTKDIETEFIKPCQRKLDFTVITLTGDRTKSFKLCKEYMAKQTVQPEQWIVVDDGKRALPIKDRSGCEYHRRKPLKTDPIHTLRVNLLEALKHVKTDFIVMVEDDDWYRQDYLEIQLKHLKDYDLVGQNSFTYWNLNEKSYHVIKKTSRPAMCLTAFKFLSVSEILKAICKNDPKVIASEADRNRIDKGSVDIHLWNRFDGKKLAYNEGENLCVGIKGVQGREGHTLGHFKENNLNYWIADKEAKRLKELIGSDVTNYIKDN